MDVDYQIRIEHLPMSGINENSRNHISTNEWDISTAAKVHTMAIFHNICGLWEGQLYAL